MLGSLNFLKISDGADRQTSLEDFRKEYREERIQNQIEYFSKNAAQSDRKARQYKFAVAAAIVVRLVHEPLDAARFLLVESTCLAAG